MRRTSVSLPSTTSTKNIAHDPFEKPARYNSKGAKDSAAFTLENIKTGWMTQSQRSRYLKTGGILLFVIFLFYYLSPSGTHVSSTASSLPNVGSTVGNAVGNADGQTPSDSSYGTTKCSKSSSKSKPIVQYAIMIDAGSTGSRIHVYKFNNCGNTPELESEEFKMTEKSAGGLSSYGSDAEGAAKSLDVLMEVALKTVPAALKSCTPIAVKATAGLRKLGPEKSKNILEAVRLRLETVYPFAVVSKENDGVVVMDGSEEGVYAWITTNYLLGKIGTPDITETAAVFDLGGGSTQIVFEPTFKPTTNGVPEKLAEGEHKYDLTFGGRHFELYQHSHLGYGLMEARDHIHKILINEMHAANPDEHHWLTLPITNPCIAPGMTRPVNITFDADHPLKSKVGEIATFEMVGPTSPAPAQCRALAEKMLYKDAECALAPCSFNGIYQPSLAKTFSKEDVYTFSFFYDRTNPLGMPESFTLKELHDLTSQVCAGEKAWDVFESIPEAITELKDRPEWCLDLNYMMALLHTGYEMPIDREVKIAKKIKGNELGWCLGASLPLLEPNSGWKCRVKEIS